MNHELIFDDYLQEQITLHPSMQPQDVMKLCYQAAFGAEHLLLDKESAQRYFNTEYIEVEKSNAPLYEPISPQIIRVNLAAWKNRNLPEAWLFKMFALTAAANSPLSGAIDFTSHMQVVRGFAKKGLLPFSAEEWGLYQATYEKDGIHPVHHSDSYRSVEKPAYRIVSTRFARLFTLLEKIAMLSHAKTSEADEHVYTIAIDGRAASGKSTMAYQLEHIIGASLVHMDDFFLPPSLRTEERFLTPGGNVHVERFIQEVLPHINQPHSFSYQVFDCEKMELCQWREVKKSKWRIVEGAYSCHPQLGAYMDFSAFSHVEPQEQLHRITLRNGKKAADIFKTRWIPMEEEYFSTFQIQKTANIIIK